MLLLRSAMSGFQTAALPKSPVDPVPVDSSLFDDIVRPYPSNRPVVADFGGMAERFNAPVLKTGDPKGSVGSNPTPSVAG